MEAHVSGMPAADRFPPTVRHCDGTAGTDLLRSSPGVIDEGNVVTLLVIKLSQRSILETNRENIRPIEGDDRSRSHRALFIVVYLTSFSSQVFHAASTGLFSSRPLIHPTFQSRPAPFPSRVHARISASAHLMRVPPPAARIGCEALPRRPDLDRPCSLAARRFNRVVVFPRDSLL